MSEPQGSPLAQPHADEPSPSPSPPPPPATTHVSQSPRIAQSASPAPAPAPEPKPAKAPAMAEAPTAPPAPIPQPQVPKAPQVMLPQQYTASQQQAQPCQPNTTKPSSKAGYPYVGYLQNETRARFYNILADLDPYKATPKEFIHLLVNAAMRDAEIGKSIYRMNEDRLRNPQTWQPIKPPEPPTQQVTPSKPSTPLLTLEQTLSSQTAMHHPPQQYAQYQVPPGFIPGPSMTAPQFIKPPQQGSPNQSESPGTANVNDSAIELDDGPSEPKEQSCNFTWVLDRAETHLGWTGNWDKCSQIRQVSIGYDIALKLQKLFKKLNAAMDKYLTFVNRVHILTVMREMIMATLETEGTVGKECRECAREFDTNFVAAVRKLTTNQLKRLKVLEGGKWVQELQDLLDEAERQNLFAHLKQALVLIDC
ncbi:Uu.00g101870.m01.CDS01 [Anthostomella pinea]|uniref:Uu.00g101870.m01.CDS01 n=1 Tax=Anthostomella pinea TaxID=933095 RepID=A0AAI8VDS6_9PEZI|nr:Uu.00g101870.m01.CDS01 [Anthostomella pinea]